MGEMMRCAKCINFDLGIAPKMAMQGFGICKIAESSNYRSAVYERVCGKYIRATDEIITERMKWLKAA